MANVYKSINEGFLRKYGDLDVASKKALKESVEKEKTEVAEARETEKLTGNAAKLKKAFPELNFGKSELKEDLKEDKIEELKIKIHDNPEAAALVKHILEILEECEDCKEEAEEEEEETEETEEAEKEELNESGIAVGKESAEDVLTLDDFLHFYDSELLHKKDEDKIKSRIDRIFAREGCPEDLYADECYAMISDKAKANISKIVKEYRKSNLKESAEDLAQDLTRYQKWVDYDMKKYGRVSDITKRALEKASLELVKDDHGDYEVIAKEDDGKAIAESVAKRGGIGKRK